MNHENIISMKEAFQSEHFFFIVMDKVNGGELLQYALNTKMSQK